MQGLARVIVVGVALCGALLLSACGKQEPAADSGYLLLFDEFESGQGEPFRTRMIVSNSYLRIDEGRDGNDFVLFDRRQRVVYNVSEEDRTILVVKPLPVELLPPKGMRHRVEKMASVDMPDVGGKPVSGYQLYTNDQVCYRVFVVEDLLEEPRQALSEFRQVLAGEHAAVESFTPTEFQSVCDAANNIFLPARHLALGFPIRNQDMSGRVRTLVDYKLDYPLNDKLFVLPEGYTRYTTLEMRTGQPG